MTVVPLPGPAASIVHRRLDDDRWTTAIVYPARPWTTNGERRRSHWDRADRTREWRQAFALLASGHPRPRYVVVDVDVQPFLTGPMQDTAACHPAAKAAIDGCVDAGLLPADTGDVVQTITFHPPIRGTNALRITITGRTSST